MWHELTEEQAREAVKRGLPTERVGNDRFVKCDAGLAIGPDGPVLPCVICDMEEAKRE